MEPMPRTIVALTRRERELVRVRLIEWFADTGHTHRYLAGRLKVSHTSVDNFCSDGSAGATFLARLIQEIPSLVHGINVHVIGGGG